MQSWDSFSGQDDYSALFESKAETISRYPSAYLSYQYTKFVLRLFNSSYIAPNETKGDGYVLKYDLLAKGVLAHLMHYVR